MALKKVSLYTDGACSGNPGPGGWGVVLLYGSHRREVSGFAPGTTNNRMELTAVIEGFKAIKEPCAVSVFSDSEIIIKAFNEGWMDNWLKTDFKKGKVKNRALWEELLAVSKPHQVRWIWVKGHADNEHNNRCDQLARNEIIKNSKDED